MGLRADPIGGGQFQQAVKQIVEAEMQPVKKLEVRKGKEDARLKLLGEFKGKFANLDKAITEISTFKKLRELKVDVGDGDHIVSVTVDKDRAEPGKYLLEVDELATRSSTISNGFEDPDDPIMGPGFIVISKEGEDDIEIYVEEDQSSLRGIANAINRSTESPVAASVYRDDSESDEPWKLMLVGKTSGEINQLEIPEFYFPDTSQELYIDDDNEAHNATLIVDGFSIESQTNDISDFLPGVNLHLKQARPDEPFFLNITEDYQKVTGKVKALVDQLNQILQFITKQNEIDEHTDTSTTFGGDSSLQSIEFNLRNLIQHPITTLGPDEEPHILHLNQIGIEFEKTGQITFKEDKFTKSLEKNFDLISQSISGPRGVGEKLRIFYDTYMRPHDGLLSNKDRGLRERIKQIDDQIDRKTQLVEQKKQRVVGQFSRLESTLAGMQRQQQFLSATLGSGGGGNIMAQLMGG